MRLPLAGSCARLTLAVAGGAWAVSMQSLSALFVVVGLSFVVYALIPAIAFLDGAWDRSTEMQARQPRALRSELLDLRSAWHHG